jgi:hypothetical protein
VPMLDGLDLVLRWFLDDVRGKFPYSAVLFADESGGALAPGDDRNRLRYLMTLQRPPGRGLVQPACAAPGVRGPQLRARGGPGGHLAASGALDGELDDEIRVSFGHVHRGCLPAGGSCHARRAVREEPGG